MVSRRLAPGKWRLHSIAMSASTVQAQAEWIAYAEAKIAEGDVANLGPEVIFRDLAAIQSCLDLSSNFVANVHRQPRNRRTTRQVGSPAGLPSAALLLISGMPGRMQRKKTLPPLVETELRELPADNGQAMRAMTCLRESAMRSVRMVPTFVCGRARR
ncbi:hypothetical protein MesoLjLc_62890 [Mesorhizobium sp. L-8-10]|nr:hypothetical protein MesoLjLb_61580 [Mesorhizobium sp. L-8-3]BCH34359.1 hypothetical protein MesoLjLc_62890 [Mesorhizobium sp. L-8-10]